MMRKFWLVLFYGFANHLPDSYTPVLGGGSNRIRIFLCKRIFKECGMRESINNKQKYLFWERKGYRDR